MVVKRNFEKDVKSEIAIKSRYDVVIGIDPDVSLSGVATLFPSQRIIETQKLEFSNLLDYLQLTHRTCLEGGKTLIVVVEAGWLIHGNWHINKFDSIQMASAKGNSTGRNQAVGLKIVECARHYGIQVVEQRPLRKCWSGGDRKISHRELKVFTRLEGRTNQEERDAALIAWSYANLPIIITAKVIK